MDFATLWRDGIGFWRTWAVTLGVRHGLLAALPGTAREAARRGGAHPGSLRVWLDAACALGIVRCRGGRYAVAPGVRAALTDRGHPDYLAGHLVYGALRSRDYDAFGDFLRRGRTLDPLRRPRRAEAIAEATAWDHAGFLRVLPATVRARLARGCDAMEFGCGTGDWLRRMRREFPRSRFSGVDPDRQAARAAGERVGYAETAGAREGADVAYFGESLHMTDIPRALANAARVLRPGGWLLVLEAFVPPRVSTRPEDAVVFAMQMDQALQGVRFMRRRDLRLPAAFGRPRFLRLGGCVALAVARRR